MFTECLTRALDRHLLTGLWFGLLFSAMRLLTGRPAAFRDVSRCLRGAGHAVMPVDGPAVGSGPKRTLFAAYERLREPGMGEVAVDVIAGEMYAREVRDPRSSLCAVAHVLNVGASGLCWRPGLR